MARITFEEIVREIEQAYRRLGHSMSWRFLCVPRAVLDAAPDVALVTMNPGGTCEVPGQGKASCEQGSAYYVEGWDAPAGTRPLQVQVQLLFETLVRHTGLPGPGRALMDRSLIAHFVPFRSPRWEHLPRKDESLRFARSLWSRILVAPRPRLIVALGNEAYKGILDVLGTEGRPKTFPTGWGDTTASVAWHRSGGETLAVVRLPHLSTYKLFTRPACEPHLEKLFSEATAHMRAR